jgi:uncharacterized BrkB/YihY/UPF0761 family membrane protein
MLRTFRVPLSWNDLFKRIASEVMADNGLNLAAQLAYYFFLALFPALIVLVALGEASLIAYFRLRSRFRRIGPTSRS